MRAAADFFHSSSRLVDVAHAPTGHADLAAMETFAPPIAAAVAPPDPLADDAYLRLADLLERNDLHTVVQPLVWLDGGDLAGADAFTRGPTGHDLEHPERLFAAAHTCGQARQLDMHCVRSALARAWALGFLDEDVALFVNVEPSTFDRSMVRDIAAMRDNLAPETRLFLEINERGIAANAPEILGACDEARSLGLGIALDDTGADPTALALLPFIAPDVVKLDSRLIRAHDRTVAAAIVGAVNAYAEDSGALIVAERIEDESDLRWATAIGAHIGQGWYFARPGVDISFDAAIEPVTRIAGPVKAPHTPFALVARTFGIGVATKAELVAMSRNLERVATGWLAGSVTFAATLEHRKHFTPATAAFYGDHLVDAPLVAVFGVDMPSHPVGTGASTVRGVALTADDPLAREWNVVVVGPHYAAALLARDLGDVDVPDGERRFEFVVTHRRDVVLSAARSLFARLAV